MHSIDFNPHPYQIQAIDWILGHEEAGLFLDMGMGKTVSTLTAMDYLLYDSYEVSKPLVIAPLQVARETWPTEVRKWSHLSHLRPSLVLGSEAERLSALKADADFFVINRENVPWLVDLLGGRWPFDMLIIDELSSFKSASAKRTKALRRIRTAVKRVVGLTGTPAPNGLLDLWPQMMLLDQGKSLGRTLTDYRARYFTPGRRQGHIVYDWLLRKGAEEEIYGRIEGTCISMQSKDYLDLPERIDVDYKIELSPSARASYEELVRDLILEIGDDGEVEASTAAVLTNKLLQLTSGQIYDEYSNIWHVHDHKLDALDDLIEQANGRPVLVYYAYRHERSAIQARHPEAVEIRDGEDTVARWNRGEIPVMLAHPASAGHGLNLQEGGNFIVWTSLTYSLELYQQANARLHRQGQTRPVTVYHLMAKDTIDERVRGILSGKEEGQNRLIEALKAELYGDRRT